MLTTRARVLLVLPPFLAAFYYLYLMGLGGSDTQHLIAFLLAGAGVFVIVQATWLRGRLTTFAVLLWNPVVVGTLGFVFGLVSAGEEATGLAYELVVGILTSFCVLWLGSLVQLRRRPRVFLSYRRVDTAAETAEILQH